MTSMDIVRLIDKVNTNKQIRWEVLENEPNKIVLTNNYDKCVKFTIKVVDDGITVLDNHMLSGVAYLCKGESRCDDYQDDAEGVRLAITTTVDYFNNTY